MVAINIGWIMLIGGVILLIVETAAPGFFIGVPGTILVVLGVTTLLIPGFAQDWAPVIIVVTAFVSSFLTILLYKRISPGQIPKSTSSDTLLEKEGIVIETISPDSLSGKVKIDNRIWSATSDNVIEAGKKVIVVKSEGVHVRVKEV